MRELRTFFILGVLGFGALQSGCSPTSWFSSGGDDPKIGDGDRYREPKLSCAGLDLSQSRLSVEAFRKVVSCLNSNGSIEPLHRLISSTSDSDLQSIVTLMNDEFVGQRTLLYQLDQTYYLLKERRTLDFTFQQMGRLLSNEDFVSSGIAILQEMSSMEHLRAVEELSGKLTEENVSILIDVLLTVAESRAFLKLQDLFSDPLPSDESIRETTSALQAFLREGLAPPHRDYGKALLQATASGSLFRISDQVFGVSEEDLRTRVRGAAAGVSLPFSENGALLSDLGSLFHLLNRPIYCMSGGAVVPNGLTHALSELSDHTEDGDAARFILRDNALKIFSMSSTCDFPRGIGLYYPSMRTIARSEAAEATSALIRAAFHEDEVLSLLTQTIIDSSPLTPAPGLRSILPILSTLNDRSAWEDLLLVASLPGEDQRPRLISTLQYLLQPRNRISGKSLYELMTHSLANADSDRLYRLVASGVRFFDYPEPVLSPAVRSIRSAYYINNVHPFIDLIRNVTAKATRYSDAYQVFFKMAETPEFPQAIRFLSEISTDGRLQTLLDAAFTLFRKFTNGAEDKDIRLTEEPPFVPTRRHNLSSQDLLRVPPPTSNPVKPECDLIDLSIGMSDFGHPGYEQNLEYFLACLDQDGEYNDLIDGIRHLRETRLPDGRNLFEMTFGWLDSFSARLTADERSDLVRRFLDGFDRGQMNQMLAALPWLTLHHLRGSDSDSGGTLVAPILNMISPLLSYREEWDRLRLIAADVLRRADFPHLLSYLEEIFERSPMPEPVPVETSYDLDAMMLAVRNRECLYDRKTGRRLPDRELQRTLEAIDDYENAVNGWEFFNGRGRREWSDSEFKVKVEPLLQKAADPKHWRKEKPVLDATLNIVRYFTLPEGSEPDPLRHYHPEQLAQWLISRSNDPRIITYFYPGEKNLRVRLVNTLDSLELLLVNADLAYLLPDNMGLKFLGMIADAWGDEPKRLWPPEITEKYRSKKPPTLREVYDAMSSELKTFEGLVGYPDLPDCPQSDGSTSPQPGGGSGASGIFPHHVKAAIYNTRQMFSVLKDNLPGSGKRHDGGLRVIRNMFYELIYSTPGNHQNARAGWKNNASVAIQLVRMGLLRQVGRTLRGVSPDDPEVTHFFNAIALGGASGNLTALLNDIIVRDRSHRLIWNLIDEVRAIQRGPAERSRLLNQGLFYTLASGGDLARLGEGSTVTDVEFFDRFTGALRELHSRHSGYLTENTSEWVDYMTTADFATLPRALYEDSDLENKARLRGLLVQVLSHSKVASDGVAFARAFSENETLALQLDLFSGRYEAFKMTPEFREIDFEKMTQDLVDFFKETPTSPTLDTSGKVRHTIASALTSDDLTETLQWISRDPGRFERLLAAIGQNAQNGKLRNFLAMARRTIEPSRSP